MRRQQTVGKVFSASSVNNLSYFRNQYDSANKRSRCTRTAHQRRQTDCRVRMGAGQSNSSSGSQSEEFSECESSPRPRTPSVRTAEPVKPRYARRGFTNLGNTCFLGALLMALSAIPEFRQSLNIVIKLLDRYERKADEMSSRVSLQTELIWELLHILDTLKKTEIAPSAKDLYKVISKLNPGLGGKQQQDVHELYIMIMDCMECVCKWLDEQMKKDGSYVSPLFESTTFYFCTQRRIKCCECKNESRSREPTVDVSLEPPEVENSDWNPFKGWGRRLDFSGQNQYKCDKCNKNVDARQYTEMVNAPNVLVGHYHVFEMVEYEGDICLRKRPKAPFPAETINMTDLCLDATLKQDDIPGYVLCSLVIHIGGNMHYGHYIAAKRIKGDEWIIYDDRTAHETTTKHLIENSKCFTPYLLFYRRQNPPITRRSTAGWEITVPSTPPPQSLPKILSDVSLKDSSSNSSISLLNWWSLKEEGSVSYYFSCFKKYLY
ncbi:unnamed protein product [Bursaphelenchus okinawaensis]|uniref:ubiquitinyl hydrolase 1 n=1 Tax=Bursaphelenchus okinawaensis TaxID=465554 RepID=A0A811LPS2_9BILA|nr:unnamed protein product [Bursaphelenchus okinawaensis]CAG9126628.1 unnamed protein product [Bursaphelenchus okinawaensis]